MISYNQAITSELTQIPKKMSSLIRLLIFIKSNFPSSIVLWFPIFMQETQFLTSSATENENTIPQFLLSILHDCRDTFFIKRNEISCFRLFTDIGGEICSKISVFSKISVRNSKFSIIFCTFAHIRTKMRLQTQIKRRQRIAH